MPAMYDGKAVFPAATKFGGRALVGAGAFMLLFSGFSTTVHDVSAFSPSFARRQELKMRPILNGLKVNTNRLLPKMPKSIKLYGRNSDDESDKNDEHDNCMGRS